MAHARSQHPNAVLTPTGRRRMVACVLDRRWSIEATAERFQVDAKTVRKWYPIPDAAAAPAGSRSLPPVESGP